MTKQAIILAGGRGTRLGTVIGDQPKAMAMVAGRPFLERVLESLARQSFGLVILATGFRKEAIRKYFGAAFGPTSLLYSEEDQPLGTGGATWRALEFASPSPCFILNGDTWVDIDFGGMEANHQAHRAVFSVAAHLAQDVSRFGALDIAEGRVVRFREKGDRGPGPINAGVYLCMPSVRSIYSMPTAFSLERDFLGPNVSALRPLAWFTSGVFIDIGVPEDLARAQRLSAFTLS